MPVACAERALPKFLEDFRKKNLTTMCSGHLTLISLIWYHITSMVTVAVHTKKDSILICSMFPALGEGTSSNPVDLYPVPGQPQKMKGRKRKHAHGDSTGQDFEAGINLLGNTLASRFLFAPLKVEFYKKKPEKV